MGGESMRLGVVDGVCEPGIVARGERFRDGVGAQ